MDRIQLLAAEIFNYSYDNYAEHLGIGNDRFDKLMPQDVTLLEKAEKENWSAQEVSQHLEIPLEQVPTLQDSYRKARSIIDAPNPSESFRKAVQYCIEFAVKQGLGDEESCERLTRQICYRVADLGFLLNERNEPLHKYSRHLRKEPDVEYYDGYFEKGPE